MPKDKYPYEQDYPPNGLTLCGNCHSLWKDKEEQTDLRSFLLYDPKIDEQLKYLSENASLVPKSQQMLLAGDKSEKINRLGESKLRQANEFSDQEEYEEAIALYDDAIRLKSDFVEAYYHRGKAKYELKRYKAAIYDYDNALRLKPGNINVYFDRGLAKYALGQYKSVIADHNMVIEFTPDNVSAYFNRGLAKYELGRHDTAITDFDEAISLKPDFAKAYYYRGLSKYEQELYDAAIADFDEVNHLDPSLKKDSPHLKLAIYEEAVRRNPKDPFGYYYRGQVNAELGQHDAARIDYDIAGSLNPKICYDVLLREIFGHK